MIALQLSELDFFLVRLGILKVARVTEARFEPPPDQLSLRAKDNPFDQSI